MKTALFRLRIKSLLLILLLLAISCSVSSKTGVNSTNHLRSIAKPRNTFDIYQLKQMEISSADQLAVSFSDSTEQCYPTTPEEGNPNWETNFVCGSQMRANPSSPREKVTAGSSVFIWIERGKRLTHLWVNRRLYPCRVDMSESAIQCEALSSDRNISSQVH